MSDYKTKIENLENALARLNEALSSPDSNELKVDACVKRFEFTYETCKKALEALVENLGFDAKNPREVIKQAGRQGFVTSLELWDDMREDRNDTTHEYNKEKAAQIAKNAEIYAKEFKFVLDKVSKINA